MARTAGLLAAVVGVASVALWSATAEAATPTYYNDLVTFQGDITNSVTDDYSNPGYVFIQDNATMSAVLGETDYMTTGFMNLNIVNGGYYCAGCNGSFLLSFQTTSVGTPVGVHGVGVYIQTHSLAVPYYAFITFGDGSTADIPLPAAGNFWGVSAPERIESIHFGLSMAGTTTMGSFGIDNLIVGDGMILSNCCGASPGGLPGCADAACEATVCGTSPSCCSSNWDAACAAQAFTDCPVLCSVCGDGMTTGAEECDDSGESAACDIDCTFVSCGDGTLNATAGEGCDDGGESPTCDPDCTTAMCGDGYFNATSGELCDDGGESATCDADCTAVECGDGVTNMAAGEACDDAGESATCNADCTAAMCGDGFVNVTAGEDCDEMVETATCDLDCTEAHCPDGYVNTTAGEECDDGNIIDGDGCSFNCKLEAVGSTGSADTGGDETTGSPGDTGVASTGDVTTGDGGSNDASGGDTFTPGSTSTPVGDDTTGGSTGPAADGGDAGDSGGCGCTTDPDPRRGAAWSLLALLGLATLRRRR